MNKKVRPARTKSPTSDDLVLNAYFGGHVEPHVLDEAFRRLELVDTKVWFTRLQAAVASILLSSVRHQLPQWAVVRDVVELRRQAQVDLDIDGHRH